MHARPRVYDPCQLGLFDAAPASPGGPIRLPMPEAEVTFWPAFLTPAEAHALFAELREGAPWRRSRRVMYGRDVDVPRMTAWYGDENERYDFEDGPIVPDGWTPGLAALRDRVEAATGARFNAVLLNRYRDGADSVAWHSDYEGMFGMRPVIPLISLGATRRFMFRPKPGREGEALALDLHAGSLLVMAGGTQQHWEHRVGKTAQAVGERISLTFRRILKPSATPRTSPTVQVGEDTLEERGEVGA
jgi:alkylated DNA repair dioxygenase AlkB